MDYTHLSKAEESSFKSSSLSIQTKTFGNAWERLLLQLTNKIHLIRKLCSKVMVQRLFNFVTLDKIFDEEFANRKCERVKKEE